MLAYSLLSIFHSRARACTRVVSVSAMLVYTRQKNIAQVLFLSDIFLFPFIRQQFPVLT